jgi:hypothetical protein
VETAEVLMLARSGEIIRVRVTLPDAAVLCEKQKRARKSLLLQFKRLKAGTEDDWEVLYSLPTPIFVNDVQVA